MTPIKKNTRLAREAMAEDYLILNGDTLVSHALVARVQATARTGALQVILAAAPWTRIACLVKAAASGNAEWTRLAVRHLDPRVGVAGAHGPHTAHPVAFAGHVAGGQAGRHALGAQHHGEGRRDLLAEAALRAVAAHAGGDLRGGQRGRRTLPVHPRAR